MNFIATIMAGGQGKRMESNIPKVLHKVNGVPMIIRIITQVLILNPKKIIIVVGKNKDHLIETINLYLTQNQRSILKYIVQEQPLGTGHAIHCCLKYFTKYQNYYNLILNGDTPLLTADTLMGVRNYGLNHNLTITSILMHEPSGNGRIKFENGEFVGIIEEKDCNENEKLIKIVNVGIYFVKNTILIKYIPMITNSNASNEYYLTDLVKCYKTKNNCKIGLYEMNPTKINETLNVNTREQLEYVNQIVI